MLITLAISAYYAGIMFNALTTLLCSKLHWHNRLKPKCQQNALYDSIAELIYINIHFSQAIKLWNNLATLAT